MSGQANTVLKSTPSHSYKIVPNQRHVLWIGGSIISGDKKNYSLLFKKNESDPYSTWARSVVGFVKHRSFAFLPPTKWQIGQQSNLPPGSGNPNARYALACPEPPPLRDHVMSSAPRRPRMPSRFSSARARLRAPPRPRPPLPEIPATHSRLGLRTHKPRVGRPLPEVPGRRWLVFLYELLFDRFLIVPCCIGLDFLSSFRFFDLGRCGVRALPDP
jgi:hypothetical protein